MKKRVPLPEALQDVHTEHCCREHGCKYDENDCTVMTGTKVQSFDCEECESDGETERQCAGQMSEFAVVEIGDALRLCGEPRARIATIRECTCGQPWRPAAGLYGTSEEMRCQACVLRDMLQRELDRIAALEAALDQSTLDHLDSVAGWLARIEAAQERIAALEAESAGTRKIVTAERNAALARIAALEAALTEKQNLLQTAADTNGACTYYDEWRQAAGVGRAPCPHCCTREHASDDYEACDRIRAALAQPVGGGP